MAVKFFEHRSKRQIFSNFEVQLALIKRDKKEFLSLLQTSVTLYIEAIAAFLKQNQLQIVALTWASSHLTWSKSIYTFSNPHMPKVRIFMHTTDYTIYATFAKNGY